MNLSKLLSLLCLISLSITSSPMLAMEACPGIAEERRRATSIEKNFEDAYHLPIELWDYIATYLPGNDRWLNDILARRIKLSKENKEKIAESFLLKIALYKSSTAFFSYSVNKPAAHLEDKNIVFPYYTDLPFLSQQYFPYSQEEMSAALKNYFRINLLPKEYHREYPLGGERILYDAHTVIGKKILKALYFVIHQIDESRWRIIREVTSMFSFFVKPEFKKSIVKQAGTILSKSEADKIVPEFSYLRDLSSQEKLILKLILQKYIRLARSLSKRNSAVELYEWLITKTFYPLLSASGISYLNEMTDILAETPIASALVDLCPRILLTSVSILFALEVYESLVNPSLVMRADIVRYEQDLEKFLSEFEDCYTSATA